MNIASKFAKQCINYFFVTGSAVGVLLIILDFCLASSSSFKRVLLIMHYFTCCFVPQALWNESC